MKLVPTIDVEAMVAAAARVRDERIRKLTVYGNPLPQGSKSGRVVGGKVILTEGFGDGPRRKRAWREAVAEAARTWVKAHPEAQPFDGPIVMFVRFYLIRPASAPKKITRPFRKPDLSKLIRAVEDSLSGLLYVDDARIVDITASKDFAENSAPRCEITLMKAEL
jgi:Holliday junction resolvase RusA-like endonuclease